MGFSAHECAHPGQLGNRRVHGALDSPRREKNTWYLTKTSNTRGENALESVGQKECGVKRFGGREEKE